MTHVEEIERAVENLPPDQLIRFREWFEAFEAQQWDKQIEADARQGKLDNLAREAMASYNAGKAREL